MSKTPFKAVEKIWNESNKDSISSEMSNQLLLKNHLLNFFHVGDYYYYIFNISNLTIEFVDEGMCKILGFNKETFTPENIFDKIHPDDIGNFVNFENTTLHFLKQLPVDKMKKYKVSYDYRIRKANGEYIRILQQNIAIETTPDGSIIRTIGMHTDISHLKKETKTSLSFIGLDGEPSYYDVDILSVMKSRDLLFTKREKEILSHISNGYKSKKIGEMLHISKTTVDTHRKNILKKTECQSITQLIAKAVKEGWV
jgi:DNA-binding CsgD family transcriptional regulator